MIKIVFEDNHIIAVEKEPGMLTQQDSSGELSLMDHVKLYLKKKYNKPGNVFLGMVQRLDRPVSGIILFARTSKAARRLNEQFREGETKKFYCALVPRINNPLSDRWIELEDAMVRIHDVSHITDKAAAGSSPVRLKYTHVFSDEKYSLLLVRLFSGKKHQIRAQLSHSGLPIAGDAKYGSGETMPGRSICLHAVSLCVTHPVNRETLLLESVIPDRFFSKIARSGPLDLDYEIKKIIRHIVADESGHDPVII